MYMQKEVTRGYNAYLTMGENDCATNMDIGLLVMFPGDEYTFKEAEKELAAIREERAFVEIKANQVEDEGREKELIVSKKEVCAQSTVKAKPIRYSQEVQSMMKPDAVIGYRDYMIGVYEHTSSQVIRKIMEVLKYA